MLQGISIITGITFTYTAGAYHGKRLAIPKLKDLVRKKSASGSAGTVWDDIKGTQPPREGTTIPKSFEINVNGEKLWVNPNGTKHMVEYSTRNFISWTKTYRATIVKEFSRCCRKSYL